MLRASGLHVYGSKAALKIELTYLRRRDPVVPQRYTVQIEGARKPGGWIDWEHKVILQLMARELAPMAAFLLGLAGERFELANHGPQADKTLSIEDQGSRMFVKLGHAGRPPIVVQVDPPEVCFLGPAGESAKHAH